MPAGSISEEKAVCFLEAPLSKVMDLVGFALPNKNNREPAAALTAATADSTYRRGRGFHMSTRLAWYG
jgi:hypothetical protein